MIHTVRRAFVALPLGLVLAGCTGNDRAEFRPAPAAAMSARTTGQGAARGIDRRVSGRDARLATPPVELVADTTASEMRYDITLDKLRELVRDNAVVVIDARGPSDFALGHVRGALNVPAGQKEVYMAQISDSIAPGQFIVIYCNGPHCDSGDMVYEYLVPQGFNNMRVFKPGWEAIASASDLR